MAKDAVATSTKKKRQIPGFSQMQRIGRSLMLPIASLPVAALLMRFSERTDSPSTHHGCSRSLTY